MKLIERIKFLLTSTNQHGVHSPFVFDYLTKCIYQKKVYPESKPIDVLLKSISYFNYNSLNILGNEKVVQLVNQRFENIQFNQHPFDLIFIEKANLDLLSKLISEGKINNDSMVLINDIHKNKDSTGIWNQLILDKKATVTIDFFSCGSIFFREEQVKEHFKIRI